MNPFAERHTLAKRGGERRGGSAGAPFDHALLWPTAALSPPRPPVAAPTIGPPFVSGGVHDGWGGRGLWRIPCSLQVRGEQRARPGGDKGEWRWD